MRHDKRYEKLDALGDWKLEHKSQDIRGMPLVSPAGEQFGIIDDLLVDRDNERVMAVRLEDGRVTPVEPLDILRAGNCGELHEQLLELRARRGQRRARLSLHRHPGYRRTRVCDPIRPRRCLLYTSPSPRDRSLSRMPSSA